MRAGMLLLILFFIISPTACPYSCQSLPDIRPHRVPLAWIMQVLVSTYITSAGSACDGERE